MLLPKPNQVEFEIAPAGTFPARCYRFIDLGTQKDEWKGTTRFVHQVRISWELPTELMEKGNNAGKPFSMTSTYTWSMGEKSNLRKVLEGWRGRKFVDADFGPGGFDTKKLIGIPCTMGIVHKQKEDGRIKDAISSVTPPMKGFDVPPQVNESLYFSFDEAMSKPSHERLAYLNDFLSKVAQGTRDAIMGTPEYRRALGEPSHADQEREENYPPAEVPGDIYDDSIPF